MKNTFKLLSLVILMFGIFNSSLLSQTNLQDENNDEDFEWVYLNLDLSYGSGGPGGALGVRYRFLGVAISATGFANDIPKTVPRISGNTSDLMEKSYPSNTVCGDVYGYYDLEEISLFANLGFYSSVDSVLLFDSEELIYYKKGAVTNGGVCWGLGAQMPLIFINEDNLYLEQLVGGVGFHSRLGVYVRIAYRW